MPRAAELAAWAAGPLDALGLEPVAEPPRSRVAVAGLDGLDASEAAAAWAAGVADTVHLVTVVPDPGAAFRDTPLSSQEAKRRARHVRGLVEPQVERLRARFPETTLVPREVEGDPRNAVLAACDEVDAELVAVGARNPTTTPDRSVGSTGERVLEDAEIPTLLSREPPGAGPVVAGVGTNPASRAAVAWGVGLADRLDRALVLAHATTGDPPEGFAAEGPRAEARAIPWPPRRGLAAVDAELDPALFVLGSGSPAGSASTSVKLTRTVPCSALVVRGASPKPPSS